MGIFKVFGTILKIYIFVRYCVNLFYKSKLSQINKEIMEIISSHSDKEYDTISFRLDFINGLLNGKQINRLVDIDERKIKNYKYSSVKDIREILDKENYDFIKVMRQIGGKLKYIKSGTTGHTFKGSIMLRDRSCVNFGVKVVAYPRKSYGNINDPKRPENAELMIITLLSQFVKNGLTPHIVLPISTFNTKIHVFTGLIEEGLIVPSKNDKKKYEKYQEFVEKYKKNYYHSNVSVLMSEWANEGDLLDFIKRRNLCLELKLWRAIFFQIISTLAVIQSKYPSFRHNDLKANNVLMQKIGNRGTHFSYKINNRQFIYPSVGYQIKIWDFDFACIPGIADNFKVSAKWTNRINVKPEQNKYYDVHFFFCTLIGFFPQLMTTNKTVHPEVTQFISRIIPKKYRRRTYIRDKKFQKNDYVTERGRILVNDEYITPFNILQKDPFFREYRELAEIVKNKNSYN